MHLFFLILTHQLLIFCVCNQQFEASIDYVISCFLIFIIISSKLNCFLINSLNICLSSSLKLGIILSSKYYIVVILSSSGISSSFNLRQAILLFLLVFSLYYICIEFILLFYSLPVIPFSRSTEYSKRQVS